jgi:hypothetical protein
MPRRPSRPQTAKPAFARAREYKLRVAEDIAERIEAKAKAEGRPQNRIIANELAEYPHLKTVGELRDHVSDLEVLLLKHSARLTWQELSEELLSNIDEALDAKVGTAQHDIAMDKIRAVRSAMKKVKKANDPDIK